MPIEGFGTVGLFDALMEEVARIQGEFAGENKVALEAKISAFKQDVEKLLQAQRGEDVIGLELLDATDNHSETICIQGASHRFFVTKPVGVSDHYEFAYLKERSDNSRE